MCACEACGEASDGQRDKAVVLLDVALEDVRAGPQHTLEARPVQLDALERAAGHHCGSTGAVHQESDLTYRREERKTGELIVLLTQTLICRPPVSSQNKDIKRWDLYSHSENLTHQSSLTVLTGPPPQTPHSLTFAVVQLHSPEHKHKALETNKQTNGCDNRSRKQADTSNMMKNSSPGSPCTTIFWLSSNCTGSRASATVKRSHLSRDSGDHRRSH